MLTSELKYTYTGQWSAYPEQGNLKEIGTKVGDVVEDNEGKKYDMVTISKSIKHSSAKFYKSGELVALEIDGLAHQAAEDSFMPIWRIISRAEDYQPSDDDLIAPAHPEQAPTSPIRTVTRKEIVPGVYGNVSVKQGAKGTVGVAIVGDVHADPRVYIGHCYVTASELRAAASTLTEIADALEDNA